MSAAILTAITDNYDTLKELCPQDVAHEAICVTDNPDLRSETWTIVYEPLNGAHPNRAAKKPKFCPWLYTDATHTVWVDASFTVNSPTLLSDVLERDAQLAQFVHPARDCLYDEAAYSAGLGKYKDEPLAEQAARYRAWGHPEHWGLWAAGIIFRRHCTQIVELGERWRDEVNAWSYQDQVSEPAILYDIGIRPVTIPGGYFADQNPWLWFNGSARH